MNAKIIVSAIAECLVVASAFGVVSVDFAAQRGEVNPRLHSSHFCPRYAASSANVEKDVAALSKLNLAAWRSHDAPLVAGGQRVVDTHFIFPLLHLDPKDPKNYFFKATDNLLAPVQEACKMKVFYRLGTSIEHTSNKNATNTLNPQDHVKYAEALAGIVRHYTRGWADGFNWDIEYWELFNEPNIAPCWRGTRDEFIDLFVTCLKRLKGEFPELKIGGPALAWLDEPFTRELLAACKKAGVAPDFFSWHWYGIDPEEPVRQTARAKELVAECGFPDVELILNEWHYLAENNWDAVRGPREAWLRTHTGPAAMNGVDSAAFTMTVEAKLQDTALSQAFFYGCGFDWCDWGYFDAVKRCYFKPYYALQAMGELVKCKTKVRATSSERGVTPFAAVSADGREAVVLVADYKSGLGSIDVVLENSPGWRLKDVRVIDDKNDLAPVDAKLEGDRLKLIKNDRLSCCFVARFVRQP